MKSMFSWVSETPFSLLSKLGSLQGNIIATMSERAYGLKMMSPLCKYGNIP